MSGKDEPIQVIMHTCMEAKLGLCLYSSLYLKLAKMLCLSCNFSSTKLEKRAEDVLPGSEGGVKEGEWEGGQQGEMAQCIHI
jgi:hypothetical protein